MLDHRKFWFVNSDPVNNQAVYKLADPAKKHFFNSPSGLGYGVDVESVKLGNSTLITEKKYTFPSTSGEMCFYADTIQQQYQDYFEFIQFMSKEPVYLFYGRPNDTIEETALKSKLVKSDAFRCLIQLTSIGKSETDSDSGMLKCNIEIQRLEPWKGPEEVLNLVYENSDSKQYELSRPYHYGKSNYASVEITNESPIDIPMRVEIIGRVKDPQWTIYQNGEVYGRARLIGTYTRVTVDSDELKETIDCSVGDSIITNTYNLQDLSVGNPKKIFVTFIRLKPGVSTLNFILGEEFRGDVNIYKQNAYLSV